MEKEKKDNLFGKPKEKAQDTLPVEPSPVNAVIQTTQTPDGMVMIKAEDLQKITERLSNLERGIVSEHLVEEEKGEMVRVTLFEGHPITDILGVHTELDKDEKEVLWMDFLVDNDGTSKQHKFEYLRVFKMDKALVPVKERRQTPVKINQGLVDKVVNDGKKMVATGERVPALVKGMKFKMLVTLPDGREVLINETAVNL